jgi:hypothetical protein
LLEVRANSQRAPGRRRSGGWGDVDARPGRAICSEPCEARPTGPKPAESRRRAAPSCTCAGPLAVRGVSEAQRRIGPPPNSARRVAETLGAGGRARLQPTIGPTKCASTSPDVAPGRPIRLLKRARPRTPASGERREPETGETVTVRLSASRANLSPVSSGECHMGQRVGLDTGSASGSRGGAAATPRARSVRQPSERARTGASEHVLPRCRWPLIWARDCGLCASAARHELR